MTPIKNIVADITSADQIKHQERVSSTRSSKTRKQGQVREDTTVESRGDTVDISSTARQLAETRDSQMARYQEMLHALGNEKENNDRIQNVQQRIAQGEFNEPSVLESIAESISNLPQFAALSETIPEESEGKELMGAVAQRIRSGEYDSEEVLERTAMNILRDIGAA